MNPQSTDTSDEDITLTLLRTIDDGSIKGLAQFHLLRMELENIRAQQPVAQGPEPADAVRGGVQRVGDHDQGVARAS